MLLPKDNSPSPRENLADEAKMTLEEIKTEYPKFRQWIKETKGYLTCGGEYLIALWYEYLERNIGR